MITWCFRKNFYTQPVHFYFRTYPEIKTINHYSPLFHKFVYKKFLYLPCIERKMFLIVKNHVYSVIILFRNPKERKKYCQYLPIWLDCGKGAGVGILADSSSRCAANARVRSRWRLGEDLSARLEVELCRDNPLIGIPPWN